jgi:putative oxidoreductase
MFDFDLSNGYVILRIICGAFLVPHIIGKFTAREASIGFFNAAGLKPAPVWSAVAMTVETVMAVCMILGIYTQIVAGVLGFYMLICAAAVIKVEKKWLWHIGGCEFCVFWAICSFIVAMHG